MKSYQAAAIAIPRTVVDMIANITYRSIKQDVIAKAVKMGVYTDFE